jgi:transcriptional regulator with XRE-family HTH domain
MGSTFGTALREMRRAAQMSQRELAEHIGLDFSYISKIENSKLPPPSADTIVAICHVLERNPGELLALTGKIPSEVQRTISSSKAAQVFLREAQQLNLTDAEWETMLHSMHKLRGESV